MSHECFADEIAIDFPSVGRVVERIRAQERGQRVLGHAPAEATPKREAAHAQRRDGVPRKTSRTIAVAATSSALRPTARAALARVIDPAA